MPEKPEDLVRRISKELSGGADFATLRQDRWEEDVVRFLLRRFNLEDQKFELLNICQRELGFKRLRLTYFNQVFDTFPVVLGARHMQRLKEKINVRQLMTNFSQLPFMADLEEFWSSIAVPGEAPPAAGLIFNWPHTPGGLIVHNIHVELDKPGIRLVWIQGEEADLPKAERKAGPVREAVTQRLVLESLHSFCEMLDGWRP